MVTLLHISDLHMGARPYHQNRVQNCHGFGIAQHLASFWHRLTGSNPEAKCIVTGDLTHAGGGLEFGNAHRFVHSQWRVGTGGSQKVGFNSNGDVAFTVPGNHDFWNGIFMTHPYVYRPVLDAHFASLPWVEIVADQNSNVEVHLLGLDSCSGLSKLSLNQTLATGAIDPTQLQTASTLLNYEYATARRNQKQVFRVAVLHHPPHHLFNRAPFLPWLANNQIEILLTGHTHIPSTPGKYTPPPFVLGCGTTTQAGQPYKPPVHGNHFYVHSLVQAGRNQVDWETLEWWYTGSSWTRNPQAVWSLQLTTI